MKHHTLSMSFYGWPLCTYMHLDSKSLSIFSCLAKFRLFLAIDKTLGALIAGGKASYDIKSHDVRFTKKSKDFIYLLFWCWWTPRPTCVLAYLWPRMDRGMQITVSSRYREGWYMENIYQTIRDIVIMYRPIYIHSSKVPTIQPWPWYIAAELVYSLWSAGILCWQCVEDTKNIVGDNCKRPET